MGLDSASNPGDGRPESAVTHLTNAYTDAPELPANLLAGSVHLLFWFFLHPAAWRNYLARVDRSVGPNFSLTDLTRGQWNDSDLRRLLVQLYVVWPLLVGSGVALTLWLDGASVTGMVVPVFFAMSIDLTLALMIGAVISVPAGAVSGLAVALAVGIVGSLTSPNTSLVLVSVAIGIAISVGCGLVSSIARPGPAYSSARQLGAIVIGVSVGVLVVSVIRFGLTAAADLMFVLPDDTGYNLARTVVVGTSYGVAIGWRRGVKVGLAGGLIVGLAYTLAIIGWKSGWSGPAVGFTSGLLFGTSFGVTVVLPFVLADWLAGSWSGAWAGSLGSWGRHVVRNNAPLWPTVPLGLLGIVLGLTLHWWLSVALYPFLMAWNLILLRLDDRNPDHVPSLLRKNSAFWDEHQRLRLKGLDEHLLLVMDRDPIEGEAALDYLSSSRQRWAARAVQIELDARCLERCQDLAALGRAHRNFPLSTTISPAGTLLRTFCHLSQDVEAASQQATTYHQRLSLSAVEDRTNGLVRELSTSSQPYAARFYPIAVSWSQLIAGQVRHLTAAVEQSQEIENPYIVGVPLTEQQEIFVGRTDIVARIEQLLLDQRHPPLLLYGQRRMGKTSLLRNLGRLLPKSIVPLFVDGQKVALASNYPDFLYNMGREMSRSAERQRGLALPPLGRQQLATSPFTGFDEWLDQVEQVLDRPEGGVALLAVDEFETLDHVTQKGRFDETDLLGLLRHLIQHRPRFKVMLAGSHTLEEFQHWSSYLINVQVMKIGYLEKNEVRHLVEAPVRDFSLKYDAAASRRVQALTRGHPALIQLLCYELVSLKNDQDPSIRRLTRPVDVETAADRAMESGSFFFSDIQRNQTDDTGLSILCFIAARGEGAVVSSDDLRLDGEGDPTVLDGALSRLLQRDLLEAVEGGYRFQVEMIRRWFERVS